MKGSGWAYAFRAALWGIAVTLTLGLALPWRDAALERYKMQHTFYGDLQGSFEGTGWGFFKRGWWLWALVIILVVGVTIVPFAYNIPIRYRGWFVAVLIVTLLLAMPFFYALFKAMQWRWWLSGIRFSSVRFELKLRSRPLIVLYWKVIGWSLLLLVVSGAYITGVLALVGSMSGKSLLIAAQIEDLVQGVPFIAALVLGYLMLILASNVVMRIYLVRDMWALVAPSLTVHGFETASNVAAQGGLASAVGEGFADGLDVAGF